MTARVGKEREEKVPREGKLKCEAMFAGNLIDVRLRDSKGSKCGVEWVALPDHKLGKKLPQRLSKGFKLTTPTLYAQHTQ